MVIDFHTHVFPEYIRHNREKYLSKDPLFFELYSSPKARMATVEELLTSMDEEGIHVSILQNISWTNSELCRETNDYILDSIARYPKRLIGMCMVRLEDPDEALKEMERCLKYGIKGIGELRPSLEILKDANIISPIFDFMKQNGLILSIHTSEPVGHSYPGKGSITPQALYPVIVRNPGLTLVCSHWGGGLPFYALMPEVKQAIQNVFFDTAASPFLYHPQIYYRVIEITGATSILFGSDYPLLQPRRLLKEIDSLNLPEEQQKQILNDNARKILKI